MQSPKDIFLILGIPPPYGGGEIRAALIEERYKARPGYRIFSYSRRASNKSTQGRVTIQNLGFGLSYILRCIGVLLHHRPEKMFLGLPKNIMAFMRIMPIILIASGLRIKVYGELAGANFRFLEKGLQRAFGLFVLRRLHSIRFLGEHIREAHAGYGFHHPVVFSNGIRIPDDRRRDPVPEEGLLQLLAVGSLERFKGTGRILEAISLCRANGLKVHCTFVGEWGDLSQKKGMERFIADNNLGEFVYFTGLITGEQKWNFYRKSHVLVHPTEWDGQPLTILEAFGFGLGVITTPVGAIPDTVIQGENGLLLSENTPQCLYEAIQTFYLDRSRLRRIMEHNAADFDQRFSVERYLANFEEWIETT